MDVYVGPLYLNSSGFSHIPNSVWQVVKLFCVVAGTVLLLNAPPAKIPDLVPYAPRLGFISGFGPTARPRLEVGRLLAQPIELVTMALHHH